MRHPKIIEALHKHLHPPHLSHGGPHEFEATKWSYLEVYYFVAFAVALAGADVYAVVYYWTK